MEFYLHYKSAKQTCVYDNFNCSKLHLNHWPIRIKKPRVSMRRPTILFQIEKMYIIILFLIILLFFSSYKILTRRLPEIEKDLKNGPILSEVYFKSELPIITIVPLKFT